MKLFLKLKSIPSYLFYSFLVHGIILFILSFVDQISQKNQKQPPPLMSVEIVSSPKNKKNPPQIRDEKAKTIVDQDKINNEVDPTAKYLSSHSQKVLKETVARNHGEFKNQKMKSQGIKQTPQKEIKQTKVAPSSKVPLMAKDLFGSYKDSLTKSMEARLQKMKDEGLTGGDISQTRDYLPGKEDGLETLLSTKEFVFYTYYSRIRNQLSQYWEPKIKKKIMGLYRQGRKIATADDHITKVLIILDNQGTLVNVQVLGASGVQDLDDVAIEAFRAAAPFPNPPKGIVDSDGTVKIQWDFVVES